MACNDGGLITLTLVSVTGVTYNGFPKVPHHQNLHPIHQRHITVPTSIPQQQVFALAEPKRKTSPFWNTITKLTPFKKWAAQSPHHEGLYSWVLEGHIQYFLETSDDTAVFFFEENNEEFDSYVKWQGKSIPCAVCSVSKDAAWDYLLFDQYFIYLKTVFIWFYGIFFKYVNIFLSSIRNNCLIPLVDVF